MNLDEFSYEDNGRRYIKPEIYVDEQNAFIDNLRQTQGERNAQIAKQTHNLGKDVTPNLGGLNGGEAYFNARYQTPQTNTTIADLRATAQAQALSTALNNELQKAQKRYNDAYRAAAARSNSNSNGNNTNGLNITTNLNSDGTIKQNDENKNRTDYLGFDGTNTFYTNSDGSKTYLDNPAAGSDIYVPFMNGLGNYANGTTKEYGGKTYMYIDKEHGAAHSPGDWYVVKNNGN